MTDSHSTDRRGAGAPREKRSLFALIAGVPAQVTELVTAEIQQLKDEMIGKLKSLGVGAGLLAGAAVIVLFAVGVFLTAAVLALSLVLPGWLAALIVAVVLLLIAAGVGFLGYSKLKRGIPPVPTRTITSLKKDLNVIRGLGK